MSCIQNACNKELDILTPCLQRDMLDVLAPVAHAYHHINRLPRIVLQGRIIMIRAIHPSSHAYPALDIIDNGENTGDKSYTNSIIFSKEKDRRDDREVTHNADVCRPPVSQGRSSDLPSTLDGP